MNFGEQMKSIRKERKLTQEQFGEKLHITRQAVSNWENNKNLPDIGMLIMISDVFDVSLDRLIKGDDEMTTMSEKLINDGSETKRARYNMISSIIGGALLFLGVLLLMIKGMSVEYIDEQGFLHENFFLIPSGFLCIFCGLISFLTIGVRTLRQRFTSK